MICSALETDLIGGKNEFHETSVSVDNILDVFCARRVEVGRISELLFIVSSDPKFSNT